MQILPKNETNIIRRAAIFDLDGCLFDDAWRVHMFDLTKPHGDERYDRYHSNSGGDGILPVGAEVLRACLATNIYPVFITARPEKWRHITADKLSSEFELGEDSADDGFKCTLLMRADGDATDTVEIKRRHVETVLRAALGEGYHIIGAFDDRQDIIDMYRGIGIPAAILDASGLSKFQTEDYDGQFIGFVGKVFYKTLPRPAPSKSSESITTETHTAGALSVSKSVHEIKYDIGSPVGKKLHDSIQCDVSQIDYSKVDTAGMYDDPAQGPSVFGVAVPGVMFDIDAHAERIAQQSPTVHPVAAALRGDAAMFEQRNAIWKSNHAQVGAIMSILYPEGIDLTTPEAHQKYHILSQVVGKLSRFAVSGNASRDSLKDMRVYAAILEDLTFPEDHSEPRDAHEDGSGRL